MSKKADNTEDNDTPKPLDFSTMSVDDIRTAHGDAAERLKEIGTPSNVAEINEQKELAGIVSEAQDAFKALSEAAASETDDLDDLIKPVGETESEGGDTATTGDDTATTGDDTEAGGDAAAESTETTETTKAPEPVTAGLGDATPSTAPKMQTFVMASSMAPGVESGDPWENVASLFKDAVPNASGWLGSMSDIYGKADVAASLGDNAAHNAKVLFGEDTRSVLAKGIVPANGRTDVTAALNCKGEPKPIMDIPYCFTTGRPLVDSGVVSILPVHNGQIQLYPEWKPALESGFNENMAECVECGDTPEIKCATHECIKPNDPLEPSRLVSCLCLPESLQWAHKFVFERAMEDFAIQADMRAELRYINAIRELSIVRNVVAADVTSSGSANVTIRKALRIAKQRLAAQPRRNTSNPFEGWVAFVPTGEALFDSAEMDLISRTDKCACPGEDLLQDLESMGADVVFGLDVDYQNSPLAAEDKVSWASTDLGEAGKADLEAPITTGEIMLIPRNTLGTATLGKHELGLGELTKDEIASGCRKLIRSEWEFDVFQYGSCATPLTLSFSDLAVDGCGNGAGPCA